MASTPQSSLTERIPITLPNCSPDPGGLIGLSEDLRALVAEGLIQAESDEHNVVRYRPTERS